MRFVRHKTVLEPYLIFQSDFPLSIGYNKQLVTDSLPESEVFPEEASPLLYAPWYDEKNPLQTVILDPRRITVRTPVQFGRYHRPMGIDGARIMVQDSHIDTCVTRLWHEPEGWRARIDGKAWPIVPGVRIFAYEGGTLIVAPGEFLKPLIGRPVKLTFDVKL